MTSLRRSMIAYAANSCGFSLISTAFSFYYVKVFLNIYKIEQSWFQASQLLYLIWNAVNDPLFAYLQDSTTTRFTKTRRESIFYFGPFFALSFVVPWLIQGHTPLFVGLHLIFTLLFWDSMFTFVGLASCCLFTEISEDPSHRLKLIQIGNIGSLIGGCSVFVIEFASDSLKNFQAFQITTVLVAICSWLLMRYSGLNAHTQYDRMAESGGEKSEQNIFDKNTNNSSYWRLTWQILSERNFYCFVTTNFFQEFHRTFLHNFMAIICDQLVPTDVVPLRIRSSFYGVMPMLPMILVILGIPFVGRIGYFKVIRLNFLCKIVGGITLFLIGRHQPWLLMLFFLLDSYIGMCLYFMMKKKCSTRRKTTDLQQGTVIIPHLQKMSRVKIFSQQQCFNILVFKSCITNATFSLFNMPLSDIADNDMRKYNRSHPISSMVFGTNALVVKPAISLSPMIVVAILNYYGYEELNKKTLEATRLDNLHNVMFYLVCFCPVILGMLQMVTWSGYKLQDNKMKGPQPQVQI